MHRRTFLALSALPLSAAAQEAPMDLSPDWEYVADRVMGGVSQGRARAEVVAGRDAMRLTGRVSTENDGGFLQIATPLNADLSARTGIELDVWGNGEVYDLRLRTADLARPWQSYRAEFTAPPAWTTIRIPFAELEANKTDAPFDASRLRRLGVVAVGRDFDADIAVAGLRAY